LIVELLVSSTGVSMRSWTEVPAPATWKHRDVAAYKAALVARYNDQIRLLRNVPYWYLLPLDVPTLWVAAHIWRKSPAAAIVVLLAVLALYVGIGWLNVVLAVRGLRVARTKSNRCFRRSEIAASRRPSEADAPTLLVTP
jgi:hypothetical protein